VTDRTYTHQHPYRGFIVATFTDSGKPVGEFGDVPIFARYYVLDEFEQNVIPHDMWHWSPVEAYASIDALHAVNPQLEVAKWGPYYDRMHAHRRLARLLPWTHERLEALRASAEDWTFNSGEECQTEVEKLFAPLFAQLKTAGPIPREMF
jgi:hypothetical protein